MGTRAPPPQSCRPLQKPHLRFSRARGSGKLPQAQARPRGPGLQSLLPTRVKALRAARAGPELREPTLLRARLALPQESSRSHTHLHPADGPSHSRYSLQWSSHQLRVQECARTPHTPHSTHTRTSHRLTHTPQYTHTDKPQTHTHPTVHTHGPHTDQPQTHTPTVHTQCCSPHIFVSSLLRLVGSVLWSAPFDPGSTGRSVCSLPHVLSSFSDWLTVRCCYSQTPRLTSWKRPGGRAGCPDTRAPATAPGRPSGGRTLALGSREQGGLPPALCPLTPWPQSTDSGTRSPVSRLRPGPLPWPSGLCMGQGSPVHSESHKLTKALLCAGGHARWGPADDKDDMKHRPSRACPSVGKGPAGQTP